MALCANPWPRRSIGQSFHRACQTDSHLRPKFVLLLEIPLSVIYTQLGDTHLVEGSKIQIVDSQGKILYAENPDELTSPSFLDFPAEGEGVKSGHQYYQ